MWIKKIDLKDNEKALLFKQGRFEKILHAGSYRLLDVFKHYTVERFDTSKLVLEHPLAKQLGTTFADKTADDLQACQLSDHEVGLLYIDGLLSDILAPGSFRLFWQGVSQIEVKRINIEQQAEVDDGLLILLARGHNLQLTRAAAQAICYTEVKDQHVGLLQVNGKLERVLAPGSYGFWAYHRHISINMVDTRLQSVDVSGQEILSKDRVSLRLNLSASYKISDPALACQQLSNADDYLYRELQLQLREAVGTRTLDQLLADKEALNQVIADGIQHKLQGLGIRVNSIGIRDIILPGEMKQILNQVVEAEKAAEANLIKRREETAATRSLHNTAKLMDNNPTLMRLKELEVLEKVTERIDTLNVYSGLEGVMKGLVKTA